MSRPNPQSPSGKWFWIYGMHEGRPFRGGRYYTREQASSDGIKLCGANFEIFELNSYTSENAGGEIKRLLALRSGNASEIFSKHRLGDSEEEKTKQEERW